MFCYVAIKSYSKNMRPYTIFVLVLLAVYIVYYTVVILWDLYGKKDEKKNAEEVFEVDTDKEDLPEEAIDVSESEHGFSVGDNDYETATDPTKEPASEAKETNGAATSPSTAEKLMAKAEEKMEECQPTFSNACNAEQLTNLLLCNGIHNDPEVRWEIFKDRL